MSQQGTPYRTRATELTGQRIGGWTVLERVYPNAADGTAMWRCQCRCGLVKDQRADYLRRRNRPDIHCASCARKLLFRRHHALVNVLVQENQRLRALVPFELLAVHDALPVTVK